MIVTWYPSSALAQMCSQNMGRQLKEREDAMRFDVIAKADGDGHKVENGTRSA